MQLIKDKKSIVLCGDVHGKFSELRHKLKRRYKIEDSIICCAGDIGMGFHKFNYYLTEFTKLSKVLQQTNNECFFVRGNHDNPEYFNGELADKLNNLPNIKFVKDYEVIETNLGNIIFIGGATSIDRKGRDVNKTYWINEKCIFDIDKINEIKQNIDYVITHTAPSFCFPQTKEGLRCWFELDKDLEKDVREERKAMDNIFNALDNNNIIKTWGYGHFHASVVDRYKGIKFVLCNELELKEL